MNFKTTFLCVLLCVSLVSCKSERSEIGNEAYRWTGELIDLGPRPPGSPGIQKAREWITKKASQSGFTVQQRPFVAKTPKGFVNMVNLSYTISGKKQDHRVILLAHYDSKLFEGVHFVGANDAASSVALLLALSSKIQKLELPFDVQIVFVDGEEAFVEWNYSDSLYGSRQWVQDLKDRSSVKAAIVVDMIGDKNLSFIRSRGVDEKFISIMENVLSDMGQSEKMESHWSYVMDDHTPFMEVGIPIMHLMDFTFGGNTSPGNHWHTTKDTMENISAESLSTTGELILRILKKI